MDDLDGTIQTLRNAIALTASTKWMGIAHHKLALASSILSSLSTPSTTTSWLTRSPLPPTSSSNCRHFHANGFLHLPSFSSRATLLKSEMSRLVSGWDPSDAVVFRTDKGQTSAQGSSDYFLDSADRVHFFAEKDSLRPDGSLAEEFRGDKVSGRANHRRQPTIPQISALNKAGHGLHLGGAFRAYTTSQGVRDLVRELGYEDPVVPQSMYIFKQARVGGEVTSHQDSTFLYTTPRQTCLGLWLALDDATVENGCLWIRPGSHMERVRRRFSRNQSYFRGDREQPQMIFENEEEDGVQWEGTVPEGGAEGLFQAGFVPIECKAGDLLVFPGELDHLSLANYSDTPRHTFQLHLVEGPAAGVTWSHTNWLQYPRGHSFLSIK